MCIIDNVPPQGLQNDGRVRTEVIDLIVNCLQLAGPEYVLQDKFHVAHSFSPRFCNQDPRFWDLVIKGWRHATTVRDDLAFATVKSALLAGRVKKSCKFRGESCSISLGKIWDEEMIQISLDSGLFDEMFSLCASPVVPLHIKSATSLRDDVPAWAESIIDATFTPDDGSGKRVAIKAIYSKYSKKPTRLSSPQLIS